MERQPIKILSIGDLHGKNILSELPINDYNYIVFLGDYIDGDIPSEDVKLLGDLIKLKQQFESKIILLLGNHDIQYFFYPGLRLKKYNEAFSFELTKLFREHEGLFDISFSISNVLWTHGGVSNKWLKMLLEGNTSTEKINAKMIDDAIKLAFKDRNWRILASTGPAKGGNSNGGILRIDKSELDLKTPKKILQVVGHTKVKGIVHQGDVIYCNCLHHVTEYLEMRFDFKNNVLESAFIIPKELPLQKKE